MPKYEVYCTEKVFHYAKVEAPSKEAALRWAQHAELERFRTYTEAEWEYPEPSEQHSPEICVEATVNAQGEEL